MYANIWIIIAFRRKISKDARCRMCKIWWRYEIVNYFYVSIDNGEDYSETEPTEVPKVLLLACAKNNDN